MNILVTGGAGYIGSVTVEALVDRGHEVVVLDDLSKGHRAAVHPDASFVEGRIDDAATVGAALRDHDVDAVVHFAAASLVGESMRDPIGYFRANASASLELFATLLDHDVRKVVFSSTAALFGTPESVPIPDDAPIAPESVYGESKRMIEQMLRWLRETKDLGYAALRYFNAAGASERFGEDHDPETHLVPIVLQVAQGRRERIEIFGDDYDTPDGTCIRDYIHVEDLADAHVRAVEALEPGVGLHYNLGNGRGFSVREVIDVCREVTGAEIPAVVSPRRPGDPPRLVADSAGIARDLGWRPRYPALRAIVASAWRWHQAHPDGYGG